MTITGKPALVKKRRIIGVLLHLSCVITLCLLPLSVVSQSAALGAPQASANNKSVVASGIYSQPAVDTPAKDKQLLILDGTQEGLPQPGAQLRAIMDTLRKNDFSVNDVFVEHLDLSRYPVLEHRADLKQLLRHKFAYQHIGMIICINQQAFEFLATDLKDLLPEVPALLVNVQKPDVFKDGNKRKIIELFSQEDIAGTLRYAIALFPEKQRLVVINGHDDSDVPFLEATAEAIDRLPTKLEVEYTGLLSYEEMLQRIATLPPNTIAFLGPYFNDRTGRKFVPAEVAAAVAKTANVPVFAEVDALICQGLFGGSTVLTDMTGRGTAEIAIDYLNGKISPTQQKTRFEIGNVPLFNWQQIDRWKISTNNLPANAIFINRPLTLWGQYKAAVISAIVAIIVLIVFIVALILQNRNRKVAEKKARESEKRFRLLIEQAPEAIVVYDADHNRFVDANTAAEKLFGCSRTELLQIGPQCFRPSEQPDQTGAGQQTLSEHTARALAGEVVRFEGIIHSADGRDLFCEIHLVKLPAESGNLIRTSIIDITARRQMEDALRESEERYRTVANFTHDWEYWQAPDLRFIYCSPSCERITGYRPEEFEEIPDLLATITHPDDRDRVVHHMDGISNPDHELHEMEFRILSRSGEVLWIAHACQIVRGPDGAYLGRRASNRDITERKRAEEDRLRLAAAIEQSGEMVVMTNREGIIQYVNPAFERITGYAAGEVVGKTPRILKSGKQNEDFYKELWGTLTVGRTWKGHFVNKRRDGLFYEEDATISPVKSLSGKITHYVAVKRDMTEQLKTEKQLHQAQKMEAIGTLAGGIAHDFNNILGAISGYTEISLAKIPPDSRIKYYLEQIHMASQRAISLVKQILEFSRLTEKEKVPITLTPLVKETIHMLREMIPSTIEIRLNAKTDQDTILGDATQLYQILMNLCTNAYQAMKGKGGILDVELVRVETGEDAHDKLRGLTPGSYLELTVRDTGEGIDPLIKERIFDPFFTTKKIGEGTGLGLSMVHGIVKSYGGKITVESRIGAGSSFHVYLPLLPEKLPDAASPRETDQRDMDGKGRILLVDDEAMLANVTKEVLEDRGYTVIAKTDSIDALEAFRAAPDQFDLVITDQTMPEMTGIDLAENIMSIRPGIPVILCTGFIDSALEENTTKAGIRAIMLKPVSMKRLIALIRDLLAPAD
ncbi:MAG: PAS domain S-box protein [Syntrophales bacterium]